MRRASLLVLLALLITSTAHAQVDQRKVVRHHTAGPWIVFGVGWAVVVGSAVTELFSQLTTMTGNSCATCPRYPPTDSARAGQIAGWTGLGAGTAMVVAGLVWHIAEPTGPVITIVPTLGGLTLHATF
jgi:hypothetical protein